MPAATKVTTTAIVPPSGHAPTLQGLALQIAIAQLGVMEMPPGSNWGKHVQKYLASVGIASPAPWCMAFVYWCVNEAAKELKMPNPLLRSGHVLSVWKASKSKHQASVPQKGDVFIMDFGGGKGHAGFVSAVTGNRIQTIEGNSNDEGSREGYEVCRHPGGRDIKTIKGYLHFL